MLRGIILDIKNQSYKNICHAINICMDQVTDIDLVEKIIDDLYDKSLSVSFHQNLHQHDNHLNTIFSVENWEEFDIFVKIDDDDIYKKDYIKTIVDYFDNNEVDVVSSVMGYQINGRFIRKGSYNNLGANPEKCDFKMPATFAFNKKALEMISNLKKVYGFEDNMWRDVWCENCIVGEVNNRENVIWHIHGKNTTTSDFLIEKQ